MKVFKNGIQYFAGRVLVALVSLAIIPVVARSLDIEAFTSFVVAWSFSLSIIGITAGTTTQAQLRFAGNRENGTYKLATVMLAITSLLIGLFCTLIFESIVFGRIYGSSVLVFGLTLYMFSLANLQARQDGGAVFRLELLRALALLMALALIYYLHSIDRGANVIYVFGLSYLTVTTVWMLLTKISFQFKFVSVRELVAVSKIIASYSLPIGVWICISNSLQLYDKLAAQHFLEPSHAASYVAKSEVLYRGSMLFLLPLVQAAHPELIKRFNTLDASGARELQLKIGFVFLVFAIFACLFVLTVGTPVIELVTSIPGIDGNVHSPMVSVLFILGAVTWSFGLIAHKGLEAASRTTSMLKLVIPCAVVHAAIVCLGGWTLNTLVMACSYSVSGAFYLILLYSQRARSSPSMRHG